MNARARNFIAANEIDRTFVLPSVQRVARIQQFVAAAYGLDPRLLKKSVRTRGVSHPRQVAMYLSRELTTKSLCTIGNLFGGLDHSTVIYAIRAVEHRMADDPLYREDVEALREALA